MQQTAWVEVSLGLPQEKQGFNYVSHDLLPPGDWSQNSSHALWYKIQASQAVTTTVPNPLPDLCISFVVVISRVYSRCNEGSSSSWLMMGPRAWERMERGEDGRHFSSTKELWVFWLIIKAIWSFCFFLKLWEMDSRHKTTWIFWKKVDPSLNVKLRTSHFELT